MNYVIMCGGQYDIWKIPRQLCRINDESLISRTVRLLHNEGVPWKDIYVSTNIPIIKEFCENNLIKVLWQEDNKWIVYKPGKSSGYWCDAFYPMASPTCYLMGDVVFSQEAIHTIVNTETDDIEFFASAPPFAKNYIKPYAEPFAFKVQNYQHLIEAQKETRLLADQKKFRRTPIAWEFWHVIKGTPLNKIDYTNYTVINDYTCDIDKPEDAVKFEQIIKSISL